LLKSHDDDVDYYKIPSRGKHYSQKWMHEDTEQEKKDSKSIMHTALITVYMHTHTRAHTHTHTLSLSLYLLQLYLFA